MERAKRTVGKVAECNLKVEKTTEVVNTEHSVVREVQVYY